MDSSVGANRVRASRSQNTQNTPPLKKAAGITRAGLLVFSRDLVIPAAFLSGGVFCVFCDLLARTLFAPTELSIGTVTSVFGAPVVIYMMVKRRKMQEV